MHQAIKLLISGDDLLFC